MFCCYRAIATNDNVFYEIFINIAFVIGLSPITTPQNLKLLSFQFESKTSFSFEYTEAWPTDSVDVGARLSAASP